MICGAKKRDGVVTYVEDESVNYTPTRARGGSYPQFAVPPTLKSQLPQQIKAQIG